MTTPALQAIKAEALAEQRDAAAPPGGGAPGTGPAPLTDEQQLEAEAREWAEIPAAFGAAVSMGMPELEQVYSDEHCMEWGRAMVPIARRYQWKAGSGMAWLRLVGVTFALVKPTVQAVIKRKRDAAAEQPGKGERIQTDEIRRPVDETVSVNAGVR